MSMTQPAPAGDSRARSVHASVSDSLNEISLITHRIGENATRFAHASPLISQIPIRFGRCVPCSTASSRRATIFCQRLGLDPVGTQPPCRSCFSDSEAILGAIDWPHPDHAPSLRKRVDR